MPKISVIIPCYNAEKYLEGCLRSVLNQTLQDIEVLCVDDGSKDRTLDMLQEYAARDPRVKILRQQNRFAGVARNTGMDAATGEYFAFLDADDTYEPDGLEQAYAIAREHDLDMLKLSSYLLDDATGEITTNAHYSHQRFVQKNRVVKFLDAPKNFLNIADVAWNGLYKAEFIREKGLRFNNFRCVNDRSFYISCMLSASRIMVADVFLTCYRRNIAGSLVSIRHKFFQCQTGSCRIIKELAQAADISDAARRLILQHELYQIFLWYEKFLDAGVNTFHVEQVIREFCREFDENDYGKEYLEKFHYRAHLGRFRESAAIQWQTGAPEEAPLVSVIVPVHNGVPFLTECLDSILLQSQRSFELICVNDGSADASAEILDCYADADSRVRILTEEQSGAGVARNNAIRLARGKYLVFVDSDDKIAPDFLEQLTAAAEAHSADVVVTQRISWLGKDEGAPMRNWVAEKRVPVNTPFSWADVPDFILNFTDGAPGGKLFRRDFVREQQLAFLELCRSEDFNFIYCAIAAAQRVVNLPLFGYFYRQNPNGLEGTKDQTPLIFWEATELFAENLKKLPCWDHIQRSYHNNTINRVAFNLKAMNSYDGFQAVFAKFKELVPVLELERHERLYFHDTTSYDYLMSVLAYDRPEDFLHRAYKQTLVPAVQKKKPEAKEEKPQQLVPRQENLLERSVSYRIGRIITFLPRKCLGLLRCLKDHGLGYTLKHGLKKLLGR